MGRHCIQHYREMARNPVFSHEELVCKMAADPDGLDLDLAKAVYDEMLAIVEKEANRRHRLAKMVSCECCWFYQRIFFPYHLAKELATKQN